MKQLRHLFYYGTLRMSREGQDIEPDIPPPP